MATRTDVEDVEPEARRDCGAQVRNLLNRLNLVGADDRCVFAYTTYYHTVETIFLVGRIRARKRTY